MGSPRTVAFHTLGCKLNFSETSSLQRMFEDHGYEVAEAFDHADVFVLNTCSVTDFADRKCRKFVRRVLRQNPDARVVVTGCYAQLKPEEIAEMEGVDLVLGAGEKFQMLDYIDQLDGAKAKGMIHTSQISELSITLSRSVIVRVLFSKSRTVVITIALSVPSPRRGVRVAAIASIK